MHCRARRIGAHEELWMSEARPAVCFGLELVGELWRLDPRSVLPRQPAVRSAVELGRPQPAVPGSLRAEHGEARVVLRGERR